MIALMLLSIITAVLLVLHLLNGSGYEMFGAVKPITALQYSSFLLFAAVLHKLRKQLMKLPAAYLGGLVAVGFFAIMATGFEVFWSFAYWFATYIKTDMAGALALDTLTYAPSNTVLYDEMNLNFSAKKNFLLLFISMYFTYYIHNLKVTKHNQ